MVSGTGTVHRISPSMDGKGHLTRIALDKSVSPDIHFSELKSDFFSNSAISLEPYLPC